MNYLFSLFNALQMHDRTSVSPVSYFLFVKEGLYHHNSQSFISLKYHIIDFILKNVACGLVNKQAGGCGITVCGILLAILKNTKAFLA